MPVAPEYQPTPAEFEDPIEYILKIENQASKFGICKIIPPFPLLNDPFGRVGTTTLYEFEIKAKWINMNKKKKNSNSALEIETLFWKVVLHSLNYLHMGASKTWYGVPRVAAVAFEDVVRVHVYGGKIKPLG
ncbi:lysine-specific demethylase REF6-like protein, putative [Medicago truncatula]|uniref:Lysine-specific demethylase REF6-like protein, putative n=1 Tax=Medicago truncatula TaxID=3880 RepID=A0A072VND5_MEDTR|nr:lysine-specific demethylase REF6-like protein, putative [Medicago truncatula]